MRLTNSVFQVRYFFHRGIIQNLMAIMMILEFENSYCVYTLFKRNPKMIRIFRICQNKYFQMKRMEKKEK